MGEIMSKKQELSKIAKEIKQIKARLSKESGKYDYSQETFWDMVQQKEMEERGSLEFFIDWAEQAEKDTLPEWHAKMHQRKWLGLEEYQFEMIWDYVQEMGAKKFIKKILSLK